jgi:hypothetical protein
MTIYYFSFKKCVIYCCLVGVIIHAWFAHGFGIQMPFSMCLQGGIMMAHDFLQITYHACGHCLVQLHQCWHHFRELDPPNIPCLANAPFCVFSLNSWTCMGSSSSSASSWKSCFFLSSAFIFIGEI